MMCYIKYDIKPDNWLCQSERRKVTESWIKSHYRDTIFDAKNTLGSSNRSFMLASNYYAITNCRIQSH